MPGVHVQRGRRVTVMQRRTEVRVEPAIEALPVEDVITWIRFPEILVLPDELGRELDAAEVPLVDRPMHDDRHRAPRFGAGPHLRQGARPRRDIRLEIDEGLTFGPEPRQRVAVSLALV